MHGQYDFNKMPLEPMGCAVLMHNKLGIKKSWDNHAIDGFYIATSNEHYRCFNIWVKDTSSNRVSDTMFFNHQNRTMIGITKADAIVAVTWQLTRALQNEILAK